MLGGAMRKPVADFFRCLFGIHCVPENWAYEYLGAIYAGGICPRCGRQKWGKFICNAWTEITKTKSGAFVVSGRDFSKAVEHGYKVRGDIEDLLEEWREAHGKGKKAIA